MSVERLGILATAQPDLVPYFSDYWAGDMDIPHSDEISARLKTAVPPQALAATQDENPETRVATLQTQLQQLGEQFQQLQQQMQQGKATEEAAVQQVKLLEQQVAQMQARMADKSEENQLDAQKNQQDHAFNMAKLRLEEQKLMLAMAQMQQQPVNGQVE
jgi:chromosome segregation ATPase